MLALAEKYRIEHRSNIMELITYNHRRESGTYAFYESLGYKYYLVLNYLLFRKKFSEI
ncbi:hypothetical protein [Coxiella-like endosymbiont]|uniref:hypothetical protein n=1 Tax=Coxiella-like endosymbiont TaxID=1592897 RepID=UPI0034E1EED9